jgi:hypothetical protein
MSSVLNRLLLKPGDHCCCVTPMALMAVTQLRELWNVRVLGEKFQYQNRIEDGEIRVEEHIERLGSY